MQTRPILVIDDDPGSCELVGSMLTQRGFKVITATDGLSGIELARAAQPAVILLDMRMPGLDGFSTCHCLTHGCLPVKIPVVAMTASTDLRYTEQVFRAGAEFLLATPFGAGSLVQVVHSAINRAQREGRRREHPRFPAELPVWCLVPGEGDTTREVMGHGRNVGLGGVLIWLPERLAPGTLFRIQLGLPTEVVIAGGKVAWQHDEVDDQLFLHGVQILRFLEDSDFLQYKRYLVQIAAGNGS